jgi:hypothetical protein
MAKDQVESFIDLATNAELSLIQILGINRQIFEELDKNLLTCFTALKRLMIVAEIPTEALPKSSGKVVFHLIHPTTSGNNDPTSAKPFRTKA